MVKLTLLLITLIFLIPYKTAACEQIKIAIIDTGLDLSDPRFAGHICNKGHRNFILDNDNTEDNNGHGTHIAGLIRSNAGEGNYCFLIYKF